VAGHATLVGRFRPRVVGPSELVAADRRRLRRAVAAKLGRVPPADQDGVRVERIQVVAGLANQWIRVSQVNRYGKGCGAPPAGGHAARPARQHPAARRPKGTPNGPFLLTLIAHTHGAEWAVMPGLLQRDAAGGAVGLLAPRSLAKLYQALRAGHLQAAPRAQPTKMSNRFRSRPPSLDPLATFRLLSALSFRQAAKREIYEKGIGYSSQSQ